MAPVHTHPMLQRQDRAQYLYLWCGRLTPADGQTGTVRQQVLHGLSAPDPALSGPVDFQQVPWGAAFRCFLHILQAAALCQKMTF